MASGQACSTTFRHPGTMMSPEMTFRLMEDAENDPIRKKALLKLKEHVDKLCGNGSGGKTSYVGNALDVVDIGYGGKGVGHKEVTGDGELCYTAALLSWAIEDGNEREMYGKVCLRILKNWAVKNKVFRGENSPLEAAWAGCAFARSAELLKYSKIESIKKGWKEIENIFLDWLVRLIMPCLKNVDVWKWPLMGNWHFSILCARMQIAILRDDHGEFKWCVDKYKEIIGKCICYGGHKCHIAETKRDLTHAQFLLGGLIQLPEMAYHQGVFDLFDKRLVDVYEYHARLMMKEVPDGICAEEIHVPYGYWYEPVWEVALGHFVGRGGLAMPCVERWCQTFRPERVTFHWGGGTLTHYKRCHK